MRPRVFPAEDDAEHEGVKAISHASMRPRVFPAEDARRSQRSRARAFACFNEAAGIPRGRLTAAWRRRRRPPTCFNEAAGIPRGRHVDIGRRGFVRWASMRPRVFPAEDEVFLVTVDTPIRRLQ